MRRVSLIILISRCLDKCALFEVCVVHFFLADRKEYWGGGWHHAQLVPKPRCSMFNSLKIPAGWPTLVKTLIFSSWHFKLTLFGRHSSKIHDSKHIPPSIFNVAWVCLAGPASLCEISAVSSDATVTAPPSSPFLIVIQLMRRKMSAGYSDCNLHAVFVADIWAEATQPVSLVLLYLADTRASGWIDDVSKQLCVCCCKPPRQRSFVTEFMVAGDGL